MRASKEPVRRARAIAPGRGVSSAHRIAAASAPTRLAQWKQRGEAKHTAARSCLGAVTPLLLFAVPASQC